MDKDRDTDAAQDPSRMQMTMCMQLHGQVLLGACPASQMLDRYLHVSRLAEIAERRYLQFPSEFRWV